MKTLIVTVVITLLGLAGLAIAQARNLLLVATKVTGASTKTASGLEYWDIKVGTGRLRPLDSTSKSITRLADQRQEVRQFSGYGKPFEFLLAGQVIKGGRRGCGMKVGGKRQLRIPPDLAYGAKGYPGRFPERNPDLRRAVGRCEIERLRGNGLAARGRTDECFRLTL